MLLDATYGIWLGWDGSGGICVCRTMIFESGQVAYGLKRRLALSKSRLLKGEGTWLQWAWILRETRDERGLFPGVLAHVFETA